ncbi:MAG: hypothetical protein ACRD1M_08060, partial [Terriglobales bacterium]
MSQHLLRYGRAAALLAVLGSVAAAQGLSRYQMAGQAIAGKFGWNVQAQVVAPEGGGPGQITFDVSDLTLPDGPSHEPWLPGAPVRIEDGASTETVVLLQSQCNISGPAPCQATADFAFAHNGRLTVQSAGDGLQEANDYLSERGGGTVVLTPDWSAPASALAVASGGATVETEDTRGGATRRHNWTAGGYAPAAALGASSGQLSAREIEDQVYA